MAGLLVGLTVASVAYTCAAAATSPALQAATNFAFATSMTGSERDAAFDA